MGPGYYNCTPTTLAGPSFHFSTGTRFSKNILDRIPERATNFDILRSNKDLEIFTPVNKKKHIQIKAIDQAKKIESTLQNKKIIAKQKKEKILTEIDSKNRRYEWKQQKESIKRIAMSWISLFAVAGSVKLLDFNLKTRKVRNI